MPRPPSRDLQQTLRPASGARATLWDEVTDPSLHAAKVEHATTTDDGDLPRVGRYTVLRRLGSGGMGVVYAAFDDSLDRKVAIKVLRERAGERPEAQGRLLREAQALARLSHPNVVAVHDVGTTDDGLVYIAMEFVTGVTLRTWLEEQVRPRAEILRVFLQAGRGLAAAHAVGLIHRDFKPDNAMVAVDGRVCVFDFGLARAASDLGERGEGPDPDPATPLGKRLNSSMTVAGTILGTPAYMAPEQHNGEPTDARTDVFSFCVALYEALYGERPFAGQTYGELLTSVRAGAVRDAPLGASVPAWLRALLLRGLAVEPRDRWPDMPALLAAIAADPAAARRRRVRLVGFLALVAAVAVGVPYGWSRVQRALAHERSESTAAHRWRVVQARIAALDANDEAEEAEAAFAAFVRADEHRGTRALTRAWLDRGARKLHGAPGASGQRSVDRPAALAAFARAYTEAGERDLEVEAMREMASMFREEWSWEPLAQALAALRAQGAGDDPVIASLGVDEALIHRDLARAAALVDEHGARTEVLAGDPRVTADLAAMRPLLTALAKMTRTRLPALEVATGDVDGDRRSDLVLLDSSRRVVTVVNHDLRVLRRDRLPAQVSQLLAGPPRALLHDGQRLQLYALGDEPRLIWQQTSASKPYTAAVLDPHDDGKPDLYLGFEPPERRFSVVPDIAGAGLDAPLRPAHPSTEASHSDVEGLLTDDLDLDGARELVAAVSAWTAYDLRVFQPGPAGLELRAHRRLGRVAGVAVVRDADGRPRIAVAKDDAYPNREIFPAAPHTGAPAGVYLFRWAGGALVEDGYVPFPRAEDRSAIEVGRVMLAGDLDGDGLADLTIAARRHGDRGPDKQRDVTLVLRQRIDGSFVTVALGGVIPVGLFDADADPAQELLAFTSDHPEDLWILGADGGNLMDPLPRPPLALVDAPAELEEAGLARDWQRASQLERVGLASAAATTLRDAAYFAQSPHHRRLMLDRAGDILHAHGEDAGAVDLFRQAAADPQLGPRALAKSAEAAIQLGRYADAHAALQALLALPAATAREAEAARARIAEIEPMARPEHELHVDFESPLADAWQIHDPIAVRRDPADGVLRVTTFSGQHELAALPIQWDGGPLRVQVELTREHLELGGSLRVVVRGDDGGLWLGAGMRASGGGGLVDHSLQCWNRHHGAWDPIDTRPQTSAAERERLHLRVEYLPGIGPITCVATDERGALRRYRGPAAAPAPPGRYWLSIGVFPDRPIDLAMARAAIHAIHVEGAAALPAGPDDPLATARRRLAEGEPLAALAGFAAAGADDPQRPLWEAAAHDDLHDSSAALAALRRALPPAAADPATPIDPAFLRLLHLRPASMGAALRELLGPRFFAVYDAAWGQAIHHHRYDPFIHRQLTADLADLDAFAPQGPDEWALKFRLLALRGRSWLRLGVNDRAREDLRAAAAMLPRVPPGQTDHLVALVWILAAKVTAAEDPTEALAYARVAVATSPTPELVAEQLQSDPDLAAFQDDPAWTSLFTPASHPAAPHDGAAPALAAPPP